MAAPLSADQMLAALRAEGVKVQEHRSWRTNNRDHKGAWGPVHGVYIHHTAGVGSGLADYCYYGSSDLPGPVCHAFASKAATVYMIGHGRANHAGGIAQNAYDAAVNESSVHPRPDAAEPIDGNAHFYGIEVENKGDGHDPYPNAQYDQVVRWAAAICRAHRWTADSVIGHKEATRRKIDPSFSMETFRDAVAERLEHPASWSPGSTPTPPVEAPDMTPEQAAQLQKVHDERRVAPWQYKGTGETRDAYAYLRGTSEAVADLAKKVDTLAPELTPEQLQALAAQVSTSPTLAETIAELVADKLAARLAE